MTLPINYVAQDLFHKDWEDENNRSLWLTLNNIIICKDKNAGDGTNEDRDWSPLVSWAKNRNVVRGQAFKFANGTDMPGRPHERLFMTLPSKINVVVELHDKADASGTIIRRIKIDRANQNEVLEGFAEDNRQLEDDIDVRDASKLLDPNRTGVGKPFATFFNDELWAALGNQDDGLDAKAKSYETQTTLGSRRIIRPSETMDKLDPDTIMHTGSILKPKEPTLVGLNSLAGMSARIGTGSELNALEGQVKEIIIRLLDSRNGEEIWSWKVNEVLENPNAVGVYFDRFLADDLSYDDIKLNFNEEIKKRVYAHEVSTAFAFETRNGNQQDFDYRRQMDENHVGAKVLTLNELKRMILLPDAKKEAYQFNLKGTPFTFIECDIKPYRASPDSQKAKDNKRLFKILPSNQNAQFDNWLNQITNSEFHAKQGFNFESQGSIVTSLDVVGAYNLPWDQIEDGDSINSQFPAKTLIVHGIATDPNDSNKKELSKIDLVIPVLQGKQPVSLSFQKRMMFNAAESQLTPYWVLEKKTFPALPFHRIRLKPPLDSYPNIEPEFARNLSVFANFMGDLKFDFAQAASRADMVATVEVPAHREHARNTPLLPINEFRDDLVNYNSLNVYRQAESKEVHVNASKDDYPVNECRPDPDTQCHTFDILQELKLAAPPLPKDNEVYDARPHYHRVFNQVVGKSRRLKLDLQHRYGPSITKEDWSYSVATHYDFPVIAPGDVSLTVPRASQVEDGSETLITADYELNNNVEKVILTLKTEHLAPVPILANEAERKKAIENHVIAWRAVAELASASVGKVRPQLRKFNYGSVVANGGNISFTDALESVAYPDSWDQTNWKISDKDKLALQELLSGKNATQKAVNLSQPFVFEALTLVKAQDKPKLHEISNLVAFDFEIHRDQEKLPSYDFSSWQIVRRERLEEFSDTDDRRGGFHHVNPDEDIEQIKNGFLKYLKDNSIRISGLSNSAHKDSEFNRFVKRLIQKDGIDSADPDSNGGNFWIAPEGLMIPDDKTAALLDVLPVALRPISTQTGLSNQPEKLIFRYFDVLSVVVNCRHDVQTNYNLDDWRTFFSTLDAASGQISGLLENVSELWWPLPHLSVGIIPPEGSFESLIYSFSNETKVRKLISKSLYKQFLNDFRLPASAKAFMTVGVKNQNKSPETRADFFRLRNVNQTIFGTAMQANGSINQIIEPLDENTISLKSAIKNDNYLGFVEGLEDKAYGNSFKVNNMTMESFEYVIETMSKNEGNVIRPQSELEELNIPLERENNKEFIRVPTGHSFLKPSSPKSVFLASRERLTAPTILVAGKFDQLQKKSTDIIIAGESFVLSALENDKRFEKPDANTPEEDKVTVVETPHIAGRTARLSDTAVTIVFAIKGDEETATNWIDGFANDRFYLDIDDILEDDLATPRQFQIADNSGDKRFEECEKLAITPEMPEQIKGLADALLRDPIAESVTEELTGEAKLEEIINPEKVCLMRLRVLPQNPAIELEPGLISFGLEANQSGTGFAPPEPILTGSPTSGDNRIIYNKTDVFLLKRGNNSSTDTNPQSFYLVVTFEVPVWRKVKTRFLQTRNDLSVGQTQQGRRFANEFVQRKTVEASFALTETHFIKGKEKYDAVPAKLNGSDLTAAQLITELLVKPSNPANAFSALRQEDQSKWEAYDCVISIFADHSGTENGFVMQTNSNGRLSVKERDEKVEGGAPLINPTIYRNEGANKNGYSIVRNWAPNGRQHYYATFQWQSRSNAQILRIEGRRFSVR